MTEMCKRLVASGIPVWRAAMFVRTLHPQIMGRRIEWRQGEAAVRIGEAPYEVFDSASFRGSPVATVYQEGRTIRVRLDGPEVRAFQLDNLRDAGGTDYLAVPIEFSNGEVHVGTWTTRRAGGFTEDHVAALAALSAPLARVTEIHALRRTATNLLDTYVGREGGARILAGQIRRGFTETIRAAIWLSDMRGFTALADTLPPPTLLELLNRYFDCQVPAVVKHGGEVLKFMGDGLLAIFPLSVEGDPHAVSHAAVSAAIEVRNAIAALADWPAPSPRYGVALHIGELLYGNVGAANRLDFTCIGPAVNLAARLQGLARDLKRTTVLSAEFARHCGDGIVPLGEFAPAGFREPQPVYGLADERN